MSRALLLIAAALACAATINTVQAYSETAQWLQTGEHAEGRMLVPASFPFTDEHPLSHDAFAAPKRPASTIQSYTPQPTEGKPSTRKMLVAVSPINTTLPLMAWSAPNPVRIKSIAYRVTTCGKTTDITRAAITTYWGSTRGNMADYINAASYGNWAWNPADQFILDVTVPCQGMDKNNKTYDASTCSGSVAYGLWWEADKAAQKLGVDPTLYPFRIMFLPHLSACPWAGLGSSSCAPKSACVVLMNTAATAFSLTPLMHEMGHNFGLQHAAYGTDAYGDHAAIMGSWSDYQMHNAPMAWAANFTRAVTGGNITSPTNLTANTWKSYTVPAVSNSTANFIRIGPEVSGDNNTYWISFKVADGYDSGIDTKIRSKLQVHTYNGGQPYNTRKTSMVVGVVAKGGVWPAGTTGATGTPPRFRVKLYSIDATGKKATVRLCRWTSIGQCV